MKKIITFLIILIISVTSIFAETIWFYKGNEYIKVENAEWDTSNTVMWDSNAVMWDYRKVSENKYRVSTDTGVLYIRVNGIVYKTSMYTIAYD